MRTESPEQSVERRDWRAGRQHVVPDAQLQREAERQSEVELAVAARANSFGNQGRPIAGTTGQSGSLSARASATNTARTVRRGSLKRSSVRRRYHRLLRHRTS